MFKNTLNLFYTNYLCLLLKTYRNTDKKILLSKGNHLNILYFFPELFSSMFIYCTHISI